jgi:hypothetical protein
MSTCQFLILLAVLFEIAPREHIRERGIGFGFLTVVFLAAAFIVWIGG